MDNFAKINLKQNLEEIPSPENPTVTALRKEDLEKTTETSKEESYLSHAIHLYRYFNGVDHFYTTNSKEIGATFVGLKGKFDYKYEGITGKCLTKQLGNSVPLYRYFNGVDHLYTIHADEIGVTETGKV